MNLFATAIGVAKGEIICYCNLCDGQKSWTQQRTVTKHEADYGFAVGHEKAGNKHTHTAEQPVFS